MRRFNIAAALSPLLFISICSAQQPGHRTVLDRNRDNRLLSDSALLPTQELMPATRAAHRSYGLPANGLPAQLMPSSPDNWNGGSGNWSDAGNWSGGEPGPTNDVTINSGNYDTVTLDTNATINSLTLGGAVNGTPSQLIEDGVARNLTIAGSLTIDVAGLLYLDYGSSITAGADSTNSGNINLGNGSLSITGNLLNLGITNIGSASSQLNVTGTLTNNGLLYIYGPGGVANVGALVNNNLLYIGAGATLNLATQLSVTDVGSSTSYQIYGTLNAGPNNPFANLTSIEGVVYLLNGQTYNITPGGGVLTLNSGQLQASSININGNVNNNLGSFSATNLNITGVLTNDPHSSFGVEGIANVGTLNNMGSVGVGPGATLNLTNQPNGFTDVMAGAGFEIEGTFDVGGNNPFAHLTSIEGAVALQNGQTWNISPGGGVLTLSNTGRLDVYLGTTINVNGNVNNSGLVSIFYPAGGTLNITGALTNEPGGELDIEGGVANIGTLNNMGTVAVGGTLNLTNQPNGITDVVAGALFSIAGTFEADGNNAFANLTGIEGTVGLGNGQTWNISPGGGVLTVTDAGTLRVSGETTININGNVDNSGLVSIGEYVNDQYPKTDTLNITGALTNEKGGELLLIGNYIPSIFDVANVGTLNNMGDVNVGPNATLNLTNQPGGITNVVAGSQFEIAGTFNAGGNNAFANLRGIEGSVTLANGQTTNITPNGGLLTIAASGVLDVSPGVSEISTVQISGDASNSGTILTGPGVSGIGGNTLTISGTLTNNPSGQIDLNNAGDTLNALTGLTNNGGINLFNGSALSTPTLNSGGTLNVDSLSTVLVGMPLLHGPSANYTQLANGTLGEMISSSGYGVINVTGSALLDGTLAILLQGGFNPAVGATFKFLNFTPGMLSGIFANIENDIFNGGTEMWLVDYDNADGYAELIAENNGAPVPEPATLLVLIPGLLGAGYGLRRKLLV